MGFMSVWVKGVGGLGGWGGGGRRKKNLWLARDETASQLSRVNTSKTAWQEGECGVERSVATCIVKLK